MVVNHPNRDIVCSENQGTSKVLRNLSAAIYHSCIKWKVTKAKCSGHSSALSNYMESGKREKNQFNSHTCKLHECMFGIWDRGNYRNCRRI
jgi:hypothetical protein